MTTAAAISRSQAQALAAADATPPLPFPQIARFRFHFEAQEPIRLPDYPGSAWRGLLGHGLRRTACVTRQRTCDGCLLAQQCVYSTLFETPAPPHHAQSGYTAMPHPFVLDIDPTAPRRLAPGDAFALGIHLIGAAISQAPYLIHALGVAGQRGFGREGGRFALTGVSRERTLGADHWDQVYTVEGGVYRAHEMAPLSPPPAPSAVRLRLITPLRIKRDGHFLGARDLASGDLIRALYRRLRTLASLQGGDPTTFDLHTLPADPKDLGWQPRWLRWHEWTRYSSRQDTLMQLGGLIGEIDLGGPALTALWPALWLGQWTHVGKGTAFGLGGYRLMADPVGDIASDAPRACEPQR
ncbi:CRISPR system precrRNA processing endoribonuclease RAMP protein Cas6 [Thiorhodococcus minor]|uniref:CRISPR system precrRNA processing endoribonuclease RAMP protein Cas6 n=1 Tax=Thiorhodococcus minor TaxID=57489 RepID=A0A6M0K3S3_9GAMM|nr:CRISPR system precrRNA processing endoribonuclease RAMP protein Cas6 [Thiorhodococcus minor]NEV64426.1 CRISPR system precrRNA processing endoribonuclease RAMP protein Cas6 [Thiorhodococcus minor]